MKRIRKLSGIVMGILLLGSMLCSCGAIKSEARENTEISLKNTQWVPEYVVMENVRIDGSSCSEVCDCSIGFDEKNIMSLTLWGITCTTDYQLDEGIFITEAPELASCEILLNGDRVIVQDKVTGNEICFREVSEESATDTQEAADEISEITAAGETEPAAEAETEAAKESGMQEPVDLTGKWEPESFLANGVSFQTPYMEYLNYQMTFYENNTVETTIWGVTYTTGYTLQEGEILIGLPQQNTVHILINDGTLELQDSVSNGAVIFGKVEAE